MRIYIKYSSLRGGVAVVPLGFLGARFLFRALGHDGGAQPAAQVIGQFVELRISINLDCLLGCVADDVAVVAPR